MSLQTTLVLNPKPDSCVTFYPFDMGAALHRQGSSRLWVLNTSAATLWCLMDGTRDTHRLATDYGRRFDLEPDAARRDVDSMLSDFAQRGLLEFDAGLSGSVETIKPNSGTVIEAKDSRRHPITFCVAGHWFRLLCGSDRLSAEWAAMVAPLVGDPDPGLPVVELVVMADPDHTDHGTRFWCCREGRFTASGLLPECVIPHLVYQVLDRVSAEERHKLLLHAAVLVHDDQAVLFAAPTGAGKSTLAAALCESGWTYLSDELAIIDPHTLRVEPYAMPIVLKPGSIDALTTIVSGLSERPIHLRDDGQQLRYLMPDRVASSGSFPIAALVFPTYRPGEENRVNTLDPLTALQQLAATGSSDRPLNEADIKTLLSLAQLPAYELTMDDLDSAARAVDKIGHLEETFENFDSF
jgi:hypothetical protein